MERKRPLVPPRLVKLPRAQLQKLRARQQRWTEKRAARRAIFNRPTPVANYLLFVARLHRLVDLFYVTLSFLLGLRFVIRLAGTNGESLVLELLELATHPFMAALDETIPPVRLGTGHLLEPSALLGLVAYGLVCQLLHRVVHAVAYRQPFPTLPPPGADTPPAG